MKVMVVQNVIRVLVKDPKSLVKGPGESKIKEGAETIQTN